MALVSANPVVSIVMPVRNEGLNLRIEPRLKRLVDAGPIDAAVIAAVG